MRPMNNREKLIDYMVSNEIERRTLAEMLCVDRETVDRWLLSRGSSRSMEVPDMAIALLEYKLRELPPRSDE